MQLSQFGLIVCKECKYAVWPEHVDHHLSRAHQLDRSSRQQIATEIGTWTGLVTSIKVPLSVAAAMPELHLYDDGIECGYCDFVCRNEEWMKKHLKKKHGWKAAEKRGGLSKAELGAAQEKLDSAVVRNVSCQRFFPSRRCSQYFKVQEECQQGPQQLSTWDQLEADGSVAYETALSRMQNAIRAGEDDEIDPWLIRTGWVRYLSGLERPDLLARIAEPTNALETAIWAATAAMIRESQETTRGCGVMLQLAAHQFEPMQRQHRPLKPYKTGIAPRAKEWQKIVMFFVRGQTGGDGDGGGGGGGGGGGDPPYLLTEAQAKALERVLQEAALADDDSDTELQLACLDFCVELLNQQAERDEYECALVCALAVLGVTETGWKDTLAYPSILSSVIKCARFMVLQMAVMKGEEADAGGSIATAAIPLTTAKGQTRRDKGPRFELERMMASFMLSGTAGPMDWMMSLRAYGLSIARQKTADGFVIWAEDGRLVYKDKRFAMTRFTDMVHGVLGEATEMLQQELLFGLGLPEIPWDSIRDTPASDADGWCFLDDGSAAWPVDGKTWLFRRIRALPDVRERFERPASEHGVARKAVSDYQAAIGRFLEKLLVLMHITGGQPARGPEILSVRHRNTAAGKLRNVLIEDGLVAFVTLYHKGYEVTAQEKVVHRYLPREVGSLLVRYLWLVVPFIERLQQLLPDPPPISFHLWPKTGDPARRRWDSVRMARALRQATSTKLGCSLGIRDYRQVAIAISRRFLRRRAQFAGGGEDGGGGSDSDGEPDHTADLQAGHGSRLAGALYARESHELAGTLATLRARFRVSSVEWHRFLGFSDARSRKRKLPFEQDADGSCRDRWRALRLISTESLFKRALGEAATPNAAQIDAYGAIKQGLSPVVAVMPTGSGKSMLFMAPAMAAPRGTTVVVVPIRALADDIAERCRGLGISCRKWAELPPPSDESIVIVQPETVATKTFQHFLNRLVLAQRLDRVVVDECHVVLNDSATFRPELRELGRLSLHAVQMVLLTATLPPSLEPKMWERMAWQASQVHIVRAATARINIRYQVVAVKTAAALDDKVDELALGAGARTIVFCRSRSKVDATVARLSGGGHSNSNGGCCRGFHSGMTDADRLESLERFRDGRVQVIAATSALGVGVDVPCVRTVVHAEDPRDLIDYAQESGRAGRDGSRATAVIVRVGTSARSGGSGGGGGGGDGVVARYVTASCRRAVLEDYLDGRTRPAGCVDGETPCDLCQPEKPKAAPRTPADDAYDQQRAKRDLLAHQYQERMMRRARFGELALKQLQQWSGVCVLCRAAACRPDEHLSSTCTLSPCRYRSRLRKWTRYIRLEAKAGCYACLAPMDVCDSQEQDDEGQWHATGHSCQFKQVLAAVVAGLDVLNPQLNAQWLQRLQDVHGVDVEDEGDMLGFLGELRVQNGLQASNLFWEFCWITERL
jgi:superfamily II DNA or RNA helicase